MKRLILFFFGAIIYSFQISFADNPYLTKIRCESLIKAIPDNPEVLTQLGIANFKLHEFRKAKEYLRKSLSLSPTFETRLWYYKSWAKLSGDNPKEKERLKKEIDQMIKARSEENLTVAYEVFAVLDTNLAKSLATEIVEKFPESPIGYAIIGHNILYDSLYPIWSNDTLKVEYLKRFLARYPKTEWRFTAYQFLLSSLFSLKDHSELITQIERMVEEEKGNPFAYNLGSSVLLRTETLSVQAKEYAQKAIELEPNFEKFKNLPEKQWQLIKPRLWFDSRFNYAHALFRLGNSDSAKSYLLSLTKAKNFDLDNDATKCPYFYLLGLIEEKKGNWRQAIDAYMESLILGDVNNYWSAKANSGLRRTLTKKFGKELNDENEILALVRKWRKYQGPIFCDVTEEVGLKGRRETRVAFGDYDNDGYEDLLLNGCRLFRNVKGEKFIEITKKAGLNDFTTNGGLFADFDNDGFLDILAIGSRIKGDRIFKNNGDGTFLDITEKANIADDFPTEGAGVGDFDNDGFLDIYLANYEDWATHRYFPDFLYQNNGDLTFRDVTREAGIIPPFNEDRAGRGVNWGDYNDDGLIDIYVSNYRLQENFLWHNTGKGKFLNLAPASDLAGDETLGYYGHTIGSVWADYDNDGDFDLLTSNLAHPRYIEFSNRTKLYQNQGPPEYKFVDQRKEAGIKYEETHSEPAFGDVDNDGDLDLYITSVYENRRSFLYQNDGHGNFRDITYLSGTRVFNGWGCAFADFDNDGDLDLVVGSGSGLKFFRNKTRNKNHYLKVKLIGRESNRFCIGAKIIAHCEGGKMARQIEGGKGTTNQNSLIAHFGFGQHNDLPRIEIKFPLGKKKILERVRLNQLLIVNE